MKKRTNLLAYASLYLLGPLLFAISAVSLANDVEPEPPVHHGEGIFLNPLVDKSSNGFFGILRARLSKDWMTYDEDRDVVPTQSPEAFSENSASVADKVHVTWIGHASVLVQHQGINVLTDPMFSKFASPVSFAGPKRITQPAIAIEDLPVIHAVFISHDHYDHLDTASIKQLGNVPMYYVPLGIKRWLVGKGIDTARIVELDWWEEATLTVGEAQLAVTATPTQHFSGRGLFNRNQTLWASWSFAWSDFHVWFGGDTGYNDVQFKQIGARLSPIDFGIIPIGAYKPRWFMQTVHVDPGEAVEIHRDIGTKQSMGIHWGAFILSGEGVLTPPKALAEAREVYDMSPAEFDVYAVGETRRYTATGR